MIQIIKKNYTALFSIDTALFSIVTAMFSIHTAMLQIPEPPVVKW